MDEILLSLNHELVCVRVDQALFVDFEVVANMSLPHFEYNQFGTTLFRVLPRHGSPPLVQSFLCLS